MPAIKVTGLKQIIANLNKARHGIQGAVAAAIYQEGMAIMRDAKVYCPVDTGRLRASGYVAPPESLDDPKVKLGFGVAYALPVHERVEAFHPNGQPLFLKRAVDEHSAGYVERIGKRAKANAEAGITVAAKRGGA
jgi:hypothetical protein